MRRIFLILFFLLPFSLHSLAAVQNHTRWWESQFGNYSNEKGTQDPRVKWAFEVFDRVKQNVEGTSVHEPHMLIINTFFNIFACALPDGGIIVNPKILDICYGTKQYNRAKGNNRLAFIIGHELSHWAHNHFLHLHIFMTVKKWEANTRNKLRGASRIAWEENEERLHFRPKELLADRMGALYAAMSGYDMRGLIWSRDNFFKHWSTQTGIRMAYDDTKHSSPEKRLKFIRSQFLKIMEHLELFNAAVLLFQMKNYSSAAKALVKFSSFYPAREVYNNLGACYFNLAMLRIHDEFSNDYFRFRLATYIDYKTTATEMISRGDGRYLEREDIARYIDKSIGYFRKAVAKNPSHKFSLINLSTALIIKKEYAEAISICNRVLESNPHDTDAINNLAVAHHYYGVKQDISHGRGKNKTETMTQKAIANLENARKVNPASPDIIYNLASLYFLSGHQDKAHSLWRDFLKLHKQIKPTPGDNFFAHIYEKLFDRKPPKKNITGPIPKCEETKSLGDFLSELQNKWKRNLIFYKLDKEQVKKKERWYLKLHVANHKNMNIIAIDDVIEIIEKKIEDIPRPSSKALLRQLGQPLRTIRHPSGYFYIFDGFSIKEIAGEATSFIWFEKD